MDDDSQGGDARDPRRGDTPDLQGLAGMLGVPQQRKDARDRRGPQTMSGRDSRDVREAGGRDANREDAPALEVVEASGQARRAAPGTTLEPATLRMDSTGLTLVVGSGRPIRAGYRDISMIAIQQATAMITLGDGADAMRWMLEQFGPRLGPLVRELRERRLKQRLTDGLVEVPDDQAELVEFEWQPSKDGFGPGSDGPAGPATGVGQLVRHEWGFVVAPIDERVTWIHYRRAAIEAFTEPAPGEVAVDGVPGRLTLRGLGPASKRFHDALAKLREGAFDDAAGFVEQMLPDAPFGLRQKASDLLVDGRPTRPEEFGNGWPDVERALLGEPEFALSYRSLCQTAGRAAPRWAAMAPEQPGGSNSKIWFLIAMPGNLVAFELVSEGAHATYFFRVMPRARYRNEPPEKLGAAAEKAVRDISEALVDCRFLREPMALPEEQLQLPDNLRYRLALAVLPSLASARARFVARIAHRDPESWSKAVADLARWHGAAREEGQEWPGRAAQEAAIAEAGGEEGGGGEAESEGESESSAGETGGMAPRKRTSAKAAPGKPPGQGPVSKSRPSGTLG
jgi:hypothetical protein